MNRIYLVGDSILKGIVYSAEQSKYRFSDRMKMQLLEESGYRVYNYSKMGATVEKGCRVLREKVTGDHRGDTVVFDFGGNDCNFNWERVSAKECDGILPFTPMDRFEAIYRECIKYAKGLGARVMVTTLVPLDDRKYMSWISRGLSRENILSWLGDESMLYRWHESYNQKVCEIASSLDCEKIDIRQHFLLSHNYSELMCIDGIHPTDKGYEIVESALCGALIDYTDNLMRA